MVVPADDLFLFVFGCVPFEKPCENKVDWNAKKGNEEPMNMLKPNFCR